MRRTAIVLAVLLAGCETIGDERAQRPHIGSKIRVGRELIEIGRNV